MSDFNKKNERKHRRLKPWVKWGVILPLFLGITVGASAAANNFYNISLTYSNSRESENQWQSLTDASASDAKNGYAFYQDTISGYTASGSNAAGGTSGCSVTDLCDVTGNMATGYTAEVTNTATFKTIKFNANGGTGTMSDLRIDGTGTLTQNAFTRADSSETLSVSYNVNGHGDVPATQSATKTTSYSFGGWATSAGGSKVYDDKESITPSGDMTLYAYWNTSTSTTSITLPSLSVTGWTFGGWYKEPGLTNKIGNGGSAYTPDQTRTVYAKWDANTYTVNYYDGSTLKGSSQHTYGTAKNLTTASALSMSRSGYTFYGWTTSTTDKSAATYGRNYTDGESVTNLTSTSGGTVNLYAVWQRTATFYSGTGKATSATATQYFNDYVTNKYYVSVPSAPASISGWNALGWRGTTAADGKQYSSAAGTVINDTNNYQNYYAVYSRTANFYSGISKTTTKAETQYYNTNGAYKITTTAAPASISSWTALGWRTDAGAAEATYAAASGTVITASDNAYYAVYSRTVSIVYAKGSGSGTAPANTNATQYYNTNPTLLTPSFTLAENTFTPPTGYAFSKWDLGNAGATYNSWTPAVDSSTVTKTATAEYTGNGYTVHFNANGGTGTMADETGFVYGTAKALTNNAFTAPSGYSFGGWAASAANATAGTVKYTNGQSITDGSSTGGTVNLYAIWKRNITFYHGSNKAKNTVVVQYYNGTTSTGANITTPTAAQCTDISGWTELGWRDDTTPGASEAAFNTSIAPSGTTYYAVYSRNATFYSGYNKAANTAVTQYYNTNNSYALTTPTAAQCTDISGWTELGWRDDTSVAESEKGFGASWNSSASTFYAVYSRTGTVSYNGNGSTGGSTSATTSEAQYLSSAGTTLNPSSLSVTLADNGFTRTGHSFTGWDLGAAGESYVWTPAYNASSDKTAYAQWSYEVTPTITRADYNSFTYAANAAEAFYVSTSDTVPSAGTGATSATFALDTWTSAITTGDLSLANGQIYYVFAKDATTGGIVSPNPATIAVRTLTRSQGAGSTLTTRYDSTSSSTGTAFNATAYVLDGTPVWASAAANNGYSSPVLKIDNVTKTAAGTSATADKNLAFASSATLNTYTITYDLNDISASVNPSHGTTHPSSYSVTTDTFTISDPTMTGYTFTGWTVTTAPSAWGSGSSTSGSKSFKVGKGTYGNIAFKANWTANTNIAYKVNHYTKNLGATTYTLNSSDSKTNGTADGSVTLANLKKTITGFTYDEGFAGKSDSGTTKPTSGAVTTTTILADGTRVINLYYSRDTHTVTLTKGTGIASVTGAGTYEYGASVTLGATASNGYAWSKWTETSGGAEVSTTNAYQFTMETSNIAYTANASASSYTITYNLNDISASVNPSHGTTHPSSYSVTTDTFTISDPTMTGYTFTGWTVTTAPSAWGSGSSASGSKSFKVGKGTYGNIAFKANWTANTNIAYKVNHYTKNLGTSTYTLNSSDSETNGTADGSVTLANLKKTITGFTYDEGFAGKSDSGTTKPTSGAVTTTTILADGTRVINLYYSRDTHTVTLTKGTGIASVTGAGTYEYGASVTLGATMSTGYDWSKWTETSGGAEVSTTNAYQFTMGTADVAYTANTTAHSYSISYDLNDTSASASPVHTNPKTSYTINDATFTLVNPTMTGYTFAGWTGSNGNTPQVTVSVMKGTTGNLSYKANWTANTNIAYKVNHYTKNLGATTYKLDSSDSKTNGTADGSVTLANLKKAITGFTYDEGFAGTSDTGTTKPSSGAVTTTTIRADGTRVINLYYSRDTHTVTLTKGTGIASVTGAGTYEYGASVTLGATMSTGYDWSKWTETSGGAEVSTTNAYQFTMGTTNIAYTANTTAHSYSISYNLNDTSGSTRAVHTDPKTSYNVTTNTFTLVNPTRVGYTFAGWTGSNGNTPQVTVSVAKGTTGNLSYKANWTANSYTYNISYVSSSGKELGSDTVTKNFDTTNTINAPAKTGYTTPASQSVVWDSTTAKGILFEYPLITYDISYTLNGGTNAQGNPDSYTVESSKITLGDATKLGYTFDGWTNTEIVTPTKAVVIPTGSTGNKSFTANYTANEYTYTFNYRSESGKALGSGTITKPFGTRMIVNPPEKTGYTTPESITVDWDSVIDKNITFTYDLISYNITYHYQGGAEDPEHTNPTSYNIESAAIVFNEPICDGKTFDGWFDAEEGGSQVTGIPAGSTGDVEVYATWHDNNYVITLDPVGGTGLVDTKIEVPQGDTADLPFNVTKNGYAFVGWSDGNTTLVPQDGHCYYTPTGNITLTAVWQRVGDLTLTETFTGRNNAWGTPSFIYEVTGTADVSGEAFHQIVKLEVGVSNTVSYTFEDLPNGSYQIRRITNCRYKPNEFNKSVTFTGESMTVSYSSSAHVLSLFSDMK